MTEERRKEGRTDVEKAGSEGEQAEERDGDNDCDICRDSVEREALAASSYYITIVILYRRVTFLGITKAILT